MNDEVIRWLLWLYQAAQEVPLEGFKDKVFSRLKTFIPLSSAVWVNSGFSSDGGLDCLGMHLFDEPESLSDELIYINRTFKQMISVALAQPGRAHSLCPPGMFPGPEHTYVRDYLHRFGHQNLLITVDTVSRHGRSEWFSLYRARRDDHFTPSEQRMMGLLSPHVTEAFAISRRLSQARLLEPGSSLAGTRALIHSNGVMLACGEPFKALIRQACPDWFSGRLPRMLLDRLRPGTVSVGARDGAILLKTERLGPYLFVEARQGPAAGGLSPRESQVAQLFAAGKTYRQVAGEIGIRPATVRNLLANVYGKLQVTSKPGLVKALRASPGVAAQEA